MSTNVSTGWLKDNNGEKFAPKTTSTQVIMSDGSNLDNKINNIKTTAAYINAENNEDVDFDPNGGGGTGNLVEISKADYDLLSEEEKNDENVAYFIPDGENTDEMLASVKRKSVTIDTVEITNTTSGGSYYCSFKTASELFGVDANKVLSVTLYDWMKAQASFEIAYNNSTDILYFISDVSQTAETVVLNVVYSATEYVGGDTIEVGNADISNIGDGTVTGAISALNSNLSSLIKTKEITGTADSTGCIYTGLRWSDGTIPIAFNSTNRYGWRYSFLNGTGDNYDQILICMFDDTLITGDITGILYYIQM